MFKNTVLISQKIYYITVMKTIQIMLFLDVIAACFENDINSTNTLGGEVEQMSMLKLVVHICGSYRYTNVRVKRKATP
jgi:hypothetical protein